jgi:small subunit ribosomal protein S7
MRKKKVIKKRLVKPDKKFGSPLVTRLKNKIMWDGEARKASKIVYQSAEIVEKETGQNFLGVLETTIENARPAYEVRSRKIGGANYRVPQALTNERGISWVFAKTVGVAREINSSQSFHQKLARVIIETFNKTGEVMKKKEILNKEAASNMAFALSLNRNRGNQTPTN